MKAEENKIMVTIQFIELPDSSIDVRVEKGEHTDLEILGMLECLKSSIVTRLAQSK
jgi:hypothetical protein